MIQKLIINQCLPFSLVESDDFKSLVHEGYSNLKVISFPTLMIHLDSNTIAILKKMFYYLKNNIVITNKYINYYYYYLNI